MKRTAQRLPACSQLLRGWLAWTHRAQAEGIQHLSLTAKVGAVVPERISQFNNAHRNKAAKTILAVHDSGAPCSGEGKSLDYPLDAHRAVPISEQDASWLPPG